jgi:hypothetical protein
MILVPKYKNIIEVGGALSIVVTDDHGAIKQDLYVPNLVVFTGKGFIASRMVGTAAAVMSHMGIGTSATAEVAGPNPPGDTALGTELSVGAGFTGYSRAAVTGTASGNVVTYTANFPANNPSAPVGGAVLREAGIFNASTAGTMLCRTTYPIVTKLPADALSITWTITIS